MTETPPDPQESAAPPGVTPVAPNASPPAGVGFAAGGAGGVARDATDGVRGGAPAVPPDGGAVRGANGASGGGGLAIGIGWLLSDLTLVTAMTVLVKKMGVDYPAVQLVFLRAVIGLVLILPWVWMRRAEVAAMRQPWRNAFRVLCNAVALNANFHAVTVMPLATVNALGYLRPLVTMGLAVVLLGEVVGRRRWVGAGLVLIGVLIAVGPQVLGLGGVALPWDGLVASGLMLVFGSLSVVQIRALKDESQVVMMLFYTVGIALFTALPAAQFWQPVRSGDWPVLLAIGVLAQAGQFCFLSAYRAADASALAPVSYSSILFATAAGWMFFAEVPGPAQILGALVILAALTWNWRREVG